MEAKYIDFRTVLGEIIAHERKNIFEAKLRERRGSEAVLALTLFENLFNLTSRLSQEHDQRMKEMLKKSMDMQAKAVLRGLGVDRLGIKVMVIDNGRQECRTGWIGTGEIQLEVDLSEVLRVDIQNNNGDVQDSTV